MFDTLIRQVRVLDGSGRGEYRASVALEGGRIAAIGELRGASARHLVEGAGLVLAPGFIDVHTHDDLHVVRDPAMLPKLSQGVTTVVVGNCGISAAPAVLRGEPPDPMNLLGAGAEFAYPHFADYTRAIDAARPAVNVTALVGHTTLRNNHMDRLDRTATQEELAAMREQLRQALRDGATGLSSGLAYGSARSADTDEVRLLAEVLGEFGALYTTHLRSEFDAILEALQEAFETAGHARVPVVVSHLKCAGAGNWGRSGQVLARLQEAARLQPVGCDCYPYSASSSTLDLAQVTDEFDIGITWSQPHPGQAGRTLAEIAGHWGVTLLQAARRLQPAGAVYHNMHEDDVRRVLAHPLSMVGSDGLPGDPMPHPRLWGTFPRVLGHYSRDLGLLPLSLAVHKMSGLSAARYGLAGRGLVREGHHADLVLFDPATVKDRASFSSPVQAAAGMEAVWVNGVLSWHQGQATGARGGRWLPRSGDLRAGFAAASPVFHKEQAMSVTPSADHNGITRYGAGAGLGQGGSQMPFARAVAADGWLYVSGQVPMDNGEVIEGGTVAQSHKAIQQVLAILQEAGYGPEHVVRCGVWLDDARDFAAFNKVFKAYFGEHAPARACVQSSLVVDAKVEIDCVAYKRA
jgi:N-acyl-D-amino-acid deacylase